MNITKKSSVLSFIVFLLILSHSFFISGENVFANNEFVTKEWVHEFDFPVDEVIETNQGNVLFVTSKIYGTYKVHSFNEDGSLKWEIPIDKLRNGNNFFATLESNLNEVGVPEQTLNFHDIVSGELLKKTPIPYDPYNEYLFEAQGDFLYLIDNSEKKMHVYNGFGEKQWTHQFEKELTNKLEKPVVYQDKVFLLDKKSDTLYCFTEKGELLWQIDSSVPSYWDVHFKGDKVYIDEYFDDITRVVDINTGETLNDFTTNFHVLNIIKNNIYFNNYSEGLFYDLDGEHEYTVQLEPSNLREEFEKRNVNMVMPSENGFTYNKDVNYFFKRIKYNTGDIDNLTYAYPSFIYGYDNFGKNVFDSGELSYVDDIKVNSNGTLFVLQNEFDTSLDVTSGNRTTSYLSVYNDNQKVQMIPFDDSSWSLKRIKDKLYVYGHSKKVYVLKDNTYQQKPTETFGRTVDKGTVKSDKQWHIGFNVSMDETTVTSENIKVFNEFGTEVDVELQTENDNKTIRIIPIVPYASGENYQLNIYKGLKSSNELNLKESVQVLFSIE